MKVFITGIAGFLGSHLAEAFLARGAEVTGIDNLLGGDPANVPSGAVWVKGDCADVLTLGAVARGNDVIYHCAATPHEGLSVFSPCLIAQHTFNSTLAVAAVAAQRGIRRVVFTSSAARYGAQPLPHTELLRPAPEDPYGIAKVAAEDSLRCLARVHGFEHVIAVPHNIIGPKQKYDDPYRNVASIMINLMLQGRQPIIYGDGLQTRSFSFVADCIAPMVEMGLRSDLDGEIINIGPDEECTSVLELAQCIARLLNVSLDPVFVPERPAEVRHTHVSADKARALLGYRTSTTLEQGLAQMIEWIQRQGPKPFTYHLPIEIDTPLVPVTWRERMFG